jgi:hypothetical protein
MKILILTHTNDNKSVDKVTEIIKNKGGQVVRFNTDGYPGDLLISTSERNGKWQNSLMINNEVHNIEDFSSIWFRRIRIGERIRALVDQKYIGPSVQEARKTFYGMLAAAECFQFDCFWRLEMADRKQLQLKVAKEVGLNIPKTLITNSHEEVKRFASTCPSGIIAKMQSSFAIYEDGQEKVVFTNAIDAYDESLSDLAYCPMTFQENIQKKLELRVVVVGNKIFTAAVDSQKTDETKTDWRKRGNELTRNWAPYVLPKDIEEKILNFMEYFKLNYGAIDIILTPDNKYYFLEINPGGEFYWLDLNCNLPICEAIADSLLGASYRR